MFFFCHLICEVLFNLQFNLIRQQHLPFIDNKSFFIIVNKYISDCLLLVCFLIWVLNFVVMLDIDVKLYSFHFNRPYIDACIRIVFKNFLNYKFFLKDEFQINNNNSFLTYKLISTRYFMIDRGKIYNFVFINCRVQSQVRMLAGY